MVEQPIPAEAARQQAERLALLASLARPVQHEINNLLTVIFANLDLVGRRVTEEAPLRQIGRVQEAARRFEATSRAILSLSRRPVPGEALISPGAALGAIEPLLSLLLPAPGALSVIRAADIPACRFDQALFDAALLGLAQAAAATRARLALTLDLVEGQAVLEARLTEGAGDDGAAAALGHLARRAGGGFTAAPGLLRLVLPVAEPAETPATI